MNDEDLEATVSISFRTSKALKEATDNEAALKNQTRTEIISSALEKYLHPDQQFDSASIGLIGVQHEHRHADYSEWIFGKNYLVLSVPNTYVWMKSFQHEYGMKGILVRNGTISIHMCEPLSEDDKLAIDSLKKLVAEVKTRGVDANLLVLALKADHQNKRWQISTDTHCFREIYTSPRDQHRYALIFNDGFYQNVLRHDDTTHFIYSSNSDA